MSASIDGGTPIVTCITEAEAAKLRELAHGRSVLEIGTAYGYSSITMARAGARHVLTIDCHGDENPNSLPILRQHLAEYGVANVTPVVAFSQTILPALAEVGARFDLVFVDGGHYAQTALHDVTHGWQLLRPDGVLAVHDFGSTHWPEVSKVIAQTFPEGGDEVVGLLWIKRKERR